MTLLIGISIDLQIDVKCFLPETKAVLPLTLSQPKHVGPGRRNKSILASCKSVNAGPGKSNKKPVHPFCKLEKAMQGPRGEISQFILPVSQQGKSNKKPTCPSHEPASLWAGRQEPSLSPCEQPADSEDS